MAQSPRLSAFVRYFFPRKTISISSPASLHPRNVSGCSRCKTIPEEKIYGRRTRAGETCALTHHNLMERTKMSRKFFMVRYKKRFGKARPSKAFKTYRPRCRDSNRLLLLIVGLDVATRILAKRTHFAILVPIGIFLGINRNRQLLKRG